MRPTPIGGLPPEDDDGVMVERRSRKPEKRHLAPQPPKKSRYAFERKKPVAPKPRTARKTATARNPSGKKRHWWEYELTPKKIKPEEVMNFSRQASAFVRAGIPILDALAVIGEDATDKKLKSTLEDIGVRVRAGESFGAAVEAHRLVFPKYFTSMVQSAELTGRLDEVLDQIAKYMDRDLETRRKVKSAMSYPAVIGVMSLLTIVVLAGFVLPRFKTFFDSFDAKLPLPTRMLMAVTDFSVDYGKYVGLGFLVVVGAIVGITRLESGKLKRDSFLLKIPQVGKLIRLAIVERFCRILSVMVEAGVPLPDAVEVASETSSNRVFRRGLKKVREQMIEGGGLAAPITESGLFPSAARQMIKVGEATGTLDEQLGAAAYHYGRELEYKLKRFTDLFEPAMIIFMGVCVGFVAVALVSAMYGIFNQVDL
jgi:type IV pilus assembly protein PilC